MSMGEGSARRLSAGSRQVAPSLVPIGKRGQGLTQMTMHMMKVLLSLMAALSFGSLMVFVAVL